MKQKFYKFMEYASEYGILFLVSGISIVMAERVTTDEVTSYMLVLILVTLAQFAMNLIHRIHKNIQKECEQEKLDKKETKEEKT